jgi:hypothetical protein
MKQTMGPKGGVGGSGRCASDVNSLLISFSKFFLVKVIGLNYVSQFAKLFEVTGLNYVSQFAKLFKVTGLNYVSQFAEVVQGHWV